MGKQARTKRAKKAGSGGNVASKVHRKAVILSGLGLLVAAILLYAIASGERENNKPAGAESVGQLSRNRSGGLVPDPPLALEHDFMGVARLPGMSPARQSAALNLIFSLENSQALQHQDDRKIFARLKQYRTERNFRSQALELVAPGSGDVRNPLMGRMGYNCVRDEFAVSPILQANIEFLALSFYHELWHAAECVEEMGRLGVTRHEDMLTAEESVPRDHCADELRAYAAQIRFFEALRLANRLPTEISAEETSDAGIFQQTMEVWKVLYDFGPDGFCAWYRRALNRGSKGPPIGPSYINSVP